MDFCIMRSTYQSAHDHLREDEYGNSARHLEDFLGFDVVAHIAQLHRVNLAPRKTKAAAVARQGHLVRDARD
jgi:hypothetical protein